MIMAEIRSVWGQYHKERELMEHRGTRNLSNSVIDNRVQFQVILNTNLRKIMTFFVSLDQ